MKVCVAAAKIIPAHIDQPRRSKYEKKTTCVLARR